MSSNPQEDDTASLSEQPLLPRSRQHKTRDSYERAAGTLMVTYGFGGHVPQPQPPKPKVPAMSAPSTSKRQKKARKEQQVPGPAHSSRPNIRKLAPPRPFPTVPTSVSATGPRSAHSEGKNRICITRKTELGMYLRRCKDVVLKDG